MRKISIEKKEKKKTLTKENKVHLTNLSQMNV